MVRAHVVHATAVSLLVAVTASGQPARTPNSQPYRVRATATATGRTGSASASARTLIDRDGQTLLELGTRTFEQAGPGVLSKVQVKAYDGNGDLLFSNNWSGGGQVPWFTVAVPGVMRGQAVDVQSNIRNVDNTRTDVVSVTTVAKLRPDLTVTALDAPSSARAGSFVHVSAIIKELNQDIGARARCTLYVDDFPVDQAEGIWVDAGDTVSCVFTHRFDGAGYHRLRADVTSMDPADWDPDNNSAVAGIAVYETEQPFAFGTASAGAWQRHYRTHISGYTRRAQGDADWVSTFDTVQEATEDTEWARYHAELFTAVQFPLMQVSVGQWTDDTLVHQAVYAGFPATVVAPTYSCGRMVDEADRVTYVEVCSYPRVGSPSTTTVAYERYAGTVSYFSSRYDAQWYETPEGTVPIYSYSFNTGSTTAEGTRWTIGNTYRFDVSLIAGGVLYSHPVSFDVPPMQVGIDVNRPWECDEFVDPLYGYKRLCTEYINYDASRFHMVNWP